MFGSGIMGLIFDSSSEESFDSYTTEDSVSDEEPEQQQPNYYLGNQLTLNEKCTISGYTLELILKDVASRIVDVNLKPTKQQLLIALHWMGIGGSMEGIANMRGISQADVLNSVKTLAHAINTVKFRETIRWPADCTSIVEQFHALADIPHVVGAIEGFLLKIDEPEEYTMEFYDRNEEYSINCMVVCGPDHKFYYATARWPGSVPDSRVFRTSRLFLEMEGSWHPIAKDGVLLGDSAYPQLPWLIRPKRTNLDEEKVQLFNNALEKTRKSVVETSLGILKRKFPCLNHVRGVEPILAINIFLCCLTLHNLTISDDDLLHDDGSENIEDNDIIDELHESYFDNFVARNTGEAKQQELINLFDSNSNAKKNVVRKRTYNERIDFMIDNEFSLNENFSISAETIELLLKDIGHRLGRTTSRNNPLSEKHQLLTSLYWMGTGDTMTQVASMHNTSSSTVCRCVHAVVDAVNEIMYPDIVDWPWPTDSTSVVEQFQAIGGMPFVVGALEGVLVNIHTPRVNREHYLDRTGKYSINCMVVCGPDHKFYSVSAECPGSEDDASVLRQSNLFQTMEEGWRPVPNGILLGDSAYPLRSWLIRPKQPTDYNELEKVQRFNIALKETRKPVVERSLGILKQKFLCLNQLKVEPVFAGNVFKCCVTLHNLTCNSDDNVADDIRYTIEDDVIVDDAYDIDNLEDAGGVARQEELMNYFAH